MAVCGILFVLLSPYTTWSLTGIFIGLGMEFGGILILGKCFHSPSKKKYKRNKSRSGAIFIWVAALLGIVVLVFGWFTLSAPTYMILEKIEALYEMPPEVTPTMSHIKNVIGLFLVVMGLGLVGWAIISSARKEDVTFPIG